ncbi:YesK family protein [Peribacillus sp. SI8-4]|uniref:YesK family protein n=1 Tax=Peribacillus sp. SI8-4 TaxID=3048009 RepID=UPI002554FB8E|nr:YesK family protein [Peribacillus sp. SI8-4]
MMMFVPLLLALIPGMIILTLTSWLCKRGVSPFLKKLPGILTMMAAFTLFYIGYVHIRGFEGAAYGFLSFFLIIFAFISFMIGKKVRV